jgi:hypothetical protein
MSVVYRDYVNKLTFNCFNKNLVSKFNSSSSPSVSLSCERSVTSFVTSFPGNVI